VFHTRTEETGFSALETYHREWDDDLKTFKANAVHDWSSHGAKAFQYLSQAWRAQKVPADSQGLADARDPDELTLEALWAANPPAKRKRV
jgi:hypothetical protein